MTLFNASLHPVSTSRYGSCHTYRPSALPHRPRHSPLWLALHASFTRQFAVPPKVRDISHTVRHFRTSHACQTAPIRSMPCQQPCTTTAALPAALPNRPANYLYQIVRTPSVPLFDQLETSVKHPGAIGKKAAATCACGHNVVGFRPAQALVHCILRAR